MIEPRDFVTIGDSSLTWEVVAVLGAEAHLVSGQSGIQRVEPRANLHLHTKGGTA